MQSEHIFTMSTFIPLAAIIHLLPLAITLAHSLKLEVVCCWQVCDNGDAVYDLRNNVPGCNISWFHGDRALVDENGGVDKEKVKSFGQDKVVLNKNYSNIISMCHCPAAEGETKVHHAGSCKYEDTRCSKNSGVCEAQQPLAGGKSDMWSTISIVVAVFAGIAVMMTYYKKRCLRSHQPISTDSNTTSDAVVDVPLMPGVDK